MSATAVAASIEQRLLWYLDYYRGRDGVLNCPVILEARGALDVPALTAALQQLAVRHESLRTTFAGRGHDLTQLVQAECPVTVNAVDARREPEPDVAVRDALALELRTRIDPTAHPFRATLWRATGERHILCLNFHHLVADGWSCGLIVRDLRALYERACGGRAELPAVAWQYAEYVRWQQELQAGAEFRVHQEYWQQQLEGMRLPALPIRGASADADARIVATDAVDIDPGVCEALRQIARTRRTTMFNVMLSLYYALVHGATGDADLAVASLFANRLRGELKETVGPFANMVILRTQLTRRPTFGDVLRETHATVVGAFLHQAVPFQMLPGLAIPSHAFRADDVVFHMAAEPLPDGRMGAVDVRGLQVEGMGNRFLLELAVIPRNAGLTAALSYHQPRVDPIWARRFVAEYAALADCVARTPDARLDVLLSQPGALLGRGVRLQPDHDHVG